ncbi:MAG TPA: hypothetical protein VF445_04845 [Bordetella sp.]|uniref:hypothetical protein n=1 Tax=Bordetella sp. TaxID=28081 RepID=UPI002ED42072
MKMKETRLTRDTKRPSKNGMYAKALARWDAEGGAGTGKPDSFSEKDSSRPRPCQDIELTQLRTRVIALENLVIALLARGSKRQRREVLDMAAFISPRQGASPHYLTIEAANRMRHLVGRGNHFSASPNI